MKQLRVMAFVDYYAPGFKGGGPLVSVSRLIAATSGPIDYWVFTRDRDLGDDRPYEGIETDSWARRKGVNSFYSSRVGVREIARAVATCQPDVVYLNSFFSRMTLCVLLLRLFGRLKGVGVVLAPRGEFSPGALAIKSRKKVVFLGLAKMVGLYRNVLWKPSTEREMTDIRAVFRRAECEVLAEIPASATELATPEKVKGECRFVFLSRVSPKKNIEMAISLVSNLGPAASLDVYGPFENAAYEAKVRGLAVGKNVRFHGPLPPALVPQTLREAHFFLFPTHGENFGHVIAESLAVGLPCVLSDATPWSDVSESGVGWAIPLADERAWTEALLTCLDMDDGDYTAMAGRVREYYTDWLTANPCEGAADLFHSSRPAA